METPVYRLEKTISYTKAIQFKLPGSGQTYSYYIAEDIQAYIRDARRYEDEYLHKAMQRRWNTYLWVFMAGSAFGSAAITVYLHYA